MAIEYHGVHLEANQTSSDTVESCISHHRKDSDTAGSLPQLRYGQQKLGRHDSAKA